MKVVQFSAVKLLISLGLFFVVSPFLEALPNADLIEASLLSLVMVAAVFAVGGRGRSRVVALLLVTPALVGKWVNHLRPDLLPPAVFLVAAMVFFAFVVGRLLVFLVRAPRVDGNVLCAGVSGFLLLGLLWIPAYLAVARLDPGAFTVPAVPGAAPGLDRFGAFYFSFITLCTVGYGDITPVSKVARMLAVMEAITGLFYMAVLISRLVSLHASGGPATGASSAGGDSPSASAP